jgi:hypothetical protein
MNETTFAIVLIFLEIIFSLMVLRTLGRSGVRMTVLSVIGVIMAGWLAIMYSLVSNGFFSATGVPQLSFPLAVVIPVILGYLAIRFYAPLRQAVDSMATADFLQLQYWRSAFGVMFFFTDALPMWFKYVGGLGDISAGIGAFLALTWFHKGSSTERQTIIRGNFVGILDFVVVIILGVGIVRQPQSPDVAFDLIPLYVVPIFILLHVFSLRRLKRTTAS